jgi:CBS domain-containing protein
MIVSDILSSKGSAVYSISPDAPVAEAVAEMAQRDIGSLVVKDDSRMVGLITLREILLAQNRFAEQLVTLPVSRIMAAQPVVAQPQNTLDEVRRLMTDHHVSHLPVVIGEELVGIISLHDLAKAVLSETQFENTMLKRYINQ